MNTQMINEYVNHANRLKMLHPHLNADEYDNTMKAMDATWKALSDEDRKAAALATSPRQLELVTPPNALKLDLACGMNCREGFEGVDLEGAGNKMDQVIAELRTKCAAGDKGPYQDLSQAHKTLSDLERGRPLLKHEMNLLRFPWPWADSSVTEIHSSHFVEHIPTEFVDERGDYVPCGTPGAKDLLFKFFDEIYRVLKPGGLATIVTPNARNNRAFQDPTHRRFIVAETFYYLFKNFRAINRLEHYNVECDFDGNVNPTVDEVFNTKDPVVQAEQSRTLWNVIHDWHVVLKSNKK